jgi:hypothetical protein
MVICADHQYPHGNSHRTFCRSPSISMSRVKLSVSEPNKVACSALRSSATASRGAGLLSEGVHFRTSITHHFAQTRTLEILQTAGTLSPTMR